MSASLMCAVVRLVVVTLSVSRPLCICICICINIVWTLQRFLYILFFNDMSGNEEDKQNEWPTLHFRITGLR